MVDFKNDCGLEWTLAYIQAWIIDLDDFVTVKNHLKDHQIQFIAKHIYNNYSLKITDLVLFFNKIKAGEYGQFFETFSPEKILEWLAEYYKDRCEYGQMVSTEKSDIDKLLAIPEDKLEKDFKFDSSKKLEHLKYGGGVGSNFKKRLKKEGVITNRKDFLTKMFKQILWMDDIDLKNYIVNNDIGTDDYDEDVFRMVETEIDRRVDFERCEKCKFYFTTVENNEGNLIKKCKCE